MKNINDDHFEELDDGIAFYENAHLKSFSKAHKGRVLPFKNAHRMASMIH